MHFYAVFALATLAGAVQISPDQKDGLWLAPLGEDSHKRESHILLKEYNATEIETRDQLSGRAIPPEGSIGCKENIDMRSTDYEGARNALSFACNEGYTSASGYAMYHKLGGANVYICNWGSKTQGCSQEELETAMTRVDDECGPTLAGANNVGAWDKIFGRNLAGARFCYT